MATIAIAVPIRPGEQSGNDVTAARWAGHFGALGHNARIVPVDEHSFVPSQATRASLSDADVLVALHARRCAPTAAWWTHQYPTRPLVVALAGTDLYGDLPHDAEAMACVESADRLVVLQAAAIDRLRSWSEDLVARTSVIYQSVEHRLPHHTPHPSELRVVVLAHLRSVKDPLLAARAARRLPTDSTVTVHHAGRAHDEPWRQAAIDEDLANPRYTWHGELDKDAAIQLLASAHVLACTSVSEGGANVVTEAIAMGVPVIGTAIDGNTGLLGDDYPALVPIGDDAALAEVLHRLERDGALLSDLHARIERLQPKTEPAAERAAWAELLDGLRRR